jgi:hypothetical protein
MSHKLPLALIALAIIMLVGCKRPVGLPNSDVHTATIQTVYCTVGDAEILTGHVDHYMDGQTPEGWYSRANPIIRRGYTEVSGYPYPRQHGFCVFTVPEFDSPNEVPTCTLFYYQSAHNGSVNLVVNEPPVVSWPGGDSTLFKAIENNYDTVATDDAHTSEGWYKVPVTTAASGVIGTIGANGGGSFTTGWRYPGTTSGIWAEVDGATNDNPPYIKVVYDDGQ